MNPWVTSTFLSSNIKHDFCYITANISPSYIQQCLNLTMHSSLRHLAAKMLSQLYNNFISFPYFFPSYETCSINVNPLFHSAIKNLHIKPYGIFVLFLSLLYLPLKLGEEVNKLTHARYNISSLNLYSKYIWFGLVWFYGISTIVGYLMPNPVYSYILNIYDLL